MRLILSERIERVRLGALELSDFVFILNVALKTGKTIEPLLEIDDLALGRQSPSTAPGLAGEISERDAIGPDALDQGRDR
jgi:hypothetical protein